MLDIDLIRENPEVIKNNLRKRGSLEKIALVEELLVWDKKRRELIAKTNELRHRRNVVSQEISKLKAGGEDFSKKLKEIKEIPEKIKKLEAEMQECGEKVKQLLFKLPNILHESVPEGRGEEDNQEVRKWEEARRFEFAKDHIDLSLALDLVDVDRAAKAAGARFYYLKNELVLLNYALIKFALDEMRGKNFSLWQPPYMLRRRGIESATDLADFEDVIYKVEGEDLYLLATSEHALLALHMDEILDGKALPLRYCGVSPCFRKEAGTHGRDTKGIFRVHQFEKVEQFIFCRPEDSWKEHERLILNAEELFQKLEIPYRVMNVCTGDIGSVAAKKYDIEAWLPGQGEYREVVSCSNCTDYQARRANIRYREEPGKPTSFVHTLNSTFVATERALVAILENYQQKDGSIKIPGVLIPYMNGMTEIR
ncbi:MAG: serine--tRNA ligase [Euryarchaeota archaeon]|nr:serine--tRNA ligase [Euryarchaeota archaeon]